MHCDNIAQIVHSMLIAVLIPAINVGIKIGLIGCAAEELVR